MSRRTRKSIENLNEEIPIEIDKKKKAPRRSSTPTPKKGNKVDELNDAIEIEKIDNTEIIHFEFSGTPGAIGIIIGLPVVIYALFYLCNSNMCMTNPIHFDWKKFFSSIDFSQMFSTKAFLIYIGWFGLNVFLERILPGEKVEGVVLPNEKRLTYVLSGHLQFWVLLLLMCHIIPIFIKVSDGVWRIKGLTPLPLSVIYDEYVGLITASVIFSSALSVYLYATSFIPGKILAKGGNTGYAIYDFFIGRELNPRIGTLDLKEFCELRPGLIGWFIINLGMAVKQYQLTKSISLSMCLVTLYQGLYVWDALYQEKAILTTMDITTDGFGFMLTFGDLAWVPFIYSLQARYLVDHDPGLTVTQLLLISAVHFFGLSSNSEKDAFRRDPDHASVSHLTYLKTKRGTKLITSGWWGSARKINYTGDWLITLSWCLLCGFKSPIPYFQAIYFLVLLIHRAIRDDHMCAEKYGEDWQTYKKQVPYLFIPKII